MSIIDRYSELSDLAESKEESFLELVNLFLKMQWYSHSANKGKKEHSRFL
jgi:hypothetical protein